MTLLKENGVMYNSADLLTGYKYMNRSGETDTRTADGVQPLWIAPFIGAIADAKRRRLVTSTSSVDLSIGTGKVFVLSLDIEIGGGILFHAIDTSNINNNGIGIVENYVSGTKTATVEFEIVNGSGLISAWDIIFGIGEQGATGVVGPDSTEERTFIISRL